MRTWWKYAVSFFVLCLVLTAMIVSFGPKQHRDAIRSEQDSHGVQQNRVLENPGQPAESK